MMDTAHFSTTILRKQRPFLPNCCNWYIKTNLLNSRFICILLIIFIASNNEFNLLCDVQHRHAAASRRYDRCSSSARSLVWSLTSAPRVLDGPCFCDATEAPSSSALQSSRCWWRRRHSRSGYDSLRWCTQGPPSRQQSSSLKTASLFSRSSPRFIKTFLATPRNSSSFSTIWNTHTL